MITGCSKYTIKGGRRIGATMLRVQTAHIIPMEGHPYERLEEEVPLLHESTEEEEVVPFNGFPHVVNSSSWSTGKAVAVVAIAWILCML